MIYVMDILGEQIQIKYHTDIDKLEQHGNWIDLRAAEDVFIPKNECRIFSLGVSMKLPEGYEAIIAPRSSTFMKYGVILVNSIGVIDNDYSGTNDVWRYLAFCMKGNTIHNGQEGSLIHKNDRVCQFRIVRNQPKITFVEVDELDPVDRGGLGSTGI